MILDRLFYLIIDKLFYLIIDKLLLVCDWEWDDDFYYNDCFGYNCDD